MPSIPIVFPEPPSLKKRLVVKKPILLPRSKVRWYLKIFENEATYCFNEPKKHRGIFNGILTGQCSEISLYSDDKEYACCNLCSIALPKYVKYDKDSYAFASEAKALLFLNKKINIFPPGYFYDSLIGDFICHHNVYWSRSMDTRKSIEKEWIKNTLEDGVKLRIKTTDRPIGFLLSGGLDSSLIASIAQKQNRSWPCGSKPLDRKQGHRD